LAGYGASQAIPGPLFTFSAYLGIFLNSGLHSWLMGLFCLFFIFLPSFLLIIGTLPIWEEIRKVSFIKRSFKAVNASVIGLLIAALYNPIISSTLKSIEDLILILFAFLILFFTKIPQWLAVFLLGLSGWGIALI
jgi:chromate transporter